MIIFRCPCGRTLKGPDSAAGRVTRCPACQTKLRIPGDPAAVLPASTDAAAVPPAGPDVGAGPPANAAVAPPPPSPPEAGLESTPATAAEVASPPASAAEPAPPPPSGPGADSPLAALAAATGAIAGSAPPDGGMPAMVAAPAGSPAFASPSFGPADFSPLPTSGCGVAGPSPRLSAKPAGAKVVQIVVGALLLLTLVLPWGNAIEPVMLWDVIGLLPLVVAVHLVACPLIGAAAIVLASVLRGLPAAIARLGLGLIGTFTLMLIIVSISGRLLDVVELVGGVSILRILIAPLLLLVMIAATSIRMKLGPMTPVRLAQFLSGGLLVIWLAVELIRLVMLFLDVASDFRQAIIVDVGVAGLIMITLAAAGVLAVVQAVTAIRKLAPSAMALLLTYCALGLTAIYLLLRFVSVANDPLVILVVLNILLVTWPIAWLLCSGTIGVVVEGVRAVRQRRDAFIPAAQAG